MPALNTRGANNFLPEKPLFTITTDASIAGEYYKRIGVKFFRTRFTPIAMAVYNLMTQRDCFRFGYGLFFMVWILLLR